MFARVLAVSLVLVLSPWMISQGAAEHGKQGGGGPGKPAPAARPAAPPIAAPRAAAPHVSAPSPRAIAPRTAAPPRRIAAPPPRVATPPRVAAPVPHAGRPHAAPPPRLAAPQRATRGAQPLAQRAQPRQAHEPRQTVGQSLPQPRQAVGRAEPARSPDRTQLRQLRAQEQKQIRDLRAQQRQARQQQGHLGRAQLRQLRAQERQQLQSLRAEQQRQRLGAVPTSPAGRVSAEAARQGRFAALFQSRAAASQARAERIAPRLAWRRGHPAAFVAWAGPVFWPYAYNDLFYYAFWPNAYDEGYWAYAYDDFIDAVFWDDGSSYAAYAYADPGAGAPPRRSGARHRPAARALAQRCEADSITAWPFDEIAGALRPTEDQQALLAELKEAAAQAAAAFKASCPGEFSLTPPGRLQAMIARLEATREALRRVRPPLARFYDSLSDEQKARFNAIGPRVATAPDRTARKEPGNSDAASCGAPKPGLTNLPIDRIEDVVRPNDQQQRALDQLSKATEKAVAVLQDACPDVVPQTPVGRLEAMEKRVDAMLQAARIVQPKLQDFYASLGNEQKARFNTLGRG